MTKKKNPSQLQYSRNFPKSCAYCSKEFLGYRANSKYCSDACRYAWQARHHTEEQIERRKENLKKWGQKNWLHRRNYMLNYAYGITGDQYDKLLRDQGGCCAVCERSETEFPRKLAVDHDHKTGEIRGILCPTCNKLTIGRHRGEEGVRILSRASLYLAREYTGFFVPKKKPKKRKPRGKNPSNSTR